MGNLTLDQGSRPSTNPSVDPSSPVDSLDTPTNSGLTPDRIDSLRQQLRTPGQEDPVSSESAYVFPSDRGLPRIIPGALAPQNQPGRSSFNPSDIYVSPDDVIDLRTLGAGGDVPFDAARNIESTVVGDRLANTAQARMNSGNISWGRCAAYVNEWIRNTSGATTVDYRGGYVYNGYPGAIDFARSIASYEGWVEVTPPPGQQFLTAEQIRQLPPGTVVAYQRNGNYVNESYTSANYYGHIGVLAPDQRTLVTDGYVPGRINVYGPDSSLNGARAFIPIPRDQSTLASARPIPQFSPEQIDQMNSDLASGALQPPEPGVRSALVENIQTQQRWVQQELRNRFGDNPAVAQVLTGLTEVPVNGIYDPSTERAINSFRQAFGLPPGGIDAEYRNLLNALITESLNHSQPQRFPSTTSAVAFAQQWTQAAASPQQTPTAPPLSAPGVMIGASPDAPPVQSGASTALLAEQDRIQLSAAERELVARIATEAPVGLFVDGGPHVQQFRELLNRVAAEHGLPPRDSQAALFGYSDLIQLLNPIRREYGLPTSADSVTTQDLRSIFGYNGN